MKLRFGALLALTALSSASVSRVDPELAQAVDLAESWGDTTSPATQTTGWGTSGWGAPSHYTTPAPIARRRTFYDRRRRFSDSRRRYSSTGETEKTVKESAAKTVAEGESKHAAQLAETQGKQDAEAAAKVIAETETKSKTSAEKTLKYNLAIEAGHKAVIEAAAKSSERAVKEHTERTEKASAEHKAEVERQAKATVEAACKATIAAGGCCNGEVKDCAGDCGGTKVIDDRCARHVALKLAMLCSDVGCPALRMNRFKDVGPLRVG